MGTTDNVKEKQFRFLYRLYQLSEGDENHPVEVGKIREEIGASNTFAKDIIDYLETEGLLNFQPGSDTVSITPGGDDEIENALINSDKATAHFPPMDKIYTTRKMEMDMSAASISDLQLVTIGSNKHRELKEVIGLLKEAADQLGLDTQQNNTLQVEINTIEGQLLSSKPKANLIPKSLDSIRRILEGSSGNPLGSSILTKIMSIIS